MKSALVNRERVRLACAAALVISVACSAEPDGASLAVIRQADTASANDKAVYDYFRAKGLTNFQAAGVVGNLDQESGIDPTIHQYNNGPGRGIAQWSAGGRWDTADGDNVVQFAQEHGKSEWDLDLQLDFIWYELNTFDYLGLADLKASTNLEEATQAFEDKYEGCVYANFPVCALPSRVDFAQRVLDAYGSNPDPVDAGTSEQDAGSDTGDSSDADAGTAGDGDSTSDGAGDGDTSGDGDGDGDTSDGPAAGDGDTPDQGNSDDGTDHSADDGATDGTDGANVPGVKTSSCSLAWPRKTDGTSSGSFWISALIASVWTYRRRRARAHA